jgi:hypothetical protein
MIVESLLEERGLVPSRRLRSSVSADEWVEFVMKKALLFLAEGLCYDPEAESHD